jgi:Transposase DDE domain
MPHLEDIQLEALLEAGYVVGLVVVALGLEQMARIAHHGSDRFETAGFRYHAVLDAWECPTGEHLALVGMNTDGRIARYRARAAACNRCPLKSDCTDSDTGREMERTVDTWPQSDITRFYRVLALVLLVLATLISGVGLVRNHGPAELLALGGVLALAAYVGHRLILTGFDRS